MKGFVMIKKHINANTKARLKSELPDIIRVNNYLVNHLELSSSFLLIFLLPYKKTDINSWTENKNLRHYGQLQDNVVCVRQLLLRSSISKIFTYFKLEMVAMLKVLD